MSRHETEKINKLKSNKKNFKPTQVNAPTPRPQAWDLDNPIERKVRGGSMKSNSTKIKY